MLLALSRVPGPRDGEEEVEEGDWVRYECALTSEIKRKGSVQAKCASQEGTKYRGHRVQNKIEG